MTAFRDAVAVTPPRDPACAGRLSNLGLSLTTRFELTRNAADLDEAINTGRDAVAATPPHDPNLAVYLLLDGAQDSDGGSLRRHWGCRWGVAAIAGGAFVGGGTWPMTMQ